MDVYIFLGFLESGKTTFIQTLLGDRHFNNGKRILIISFEEGETELEISESTVSNVFLREEPESTEDLCTWQNQICPDVVLIEYNGMQSVQNLLDFLPKEWTVTRILMFANSLTFSTYNRNMRNLAYDKLIHCNSVVFNRCNGDTDLEALHKIVRGVSSLPTIVYEFENGRSYPDTIQDVLPYDMNGEMIEIADEDYALWYRDIMENPQLYRGKSVRFKCQYQSTGENIIVGRKIMTCCADDIAFGGLVCRCEASFPPSPWVMVEGELQFRLDPTLGRNKPELKCLSVEPTVPPLNEVASISL